MVTAKSNSEDTLKKEKTIYSKIITVHGMVCAFCSSSLEKKLKKEEAIDQIEVDMANQKISILFKKDKSVENKKLEKIITASGFKFVGIESPTNSTSPNTKSNPSVKSNPSTKSNSSVKQ